MPDVLIATLPYGEKVVGAVLLGMYDVTDPAYQGIITHWFNRLTAGNHTLRDGNTRVRRHGDILTVTTPKGTPLSRGLKRYAEIVDGETRWEKI